MIPKLCIHTYTQDPRGGTRGRFRRNQLLRGLWKIQRRGEGQEEEIGAKRIERDVSPCDDAGFGRALGPCLQCGRGPVPRPFSCTARGTRHEAQSAVVLRQRSLASTHNRGIQLRARSIDQHYRRSPDVVCWCSISLSLRPLPLLFLSLE